MQLETLLQLALSGLAMGGIYAFIAVGFVTIHAVTGFINFAQGEFAMVAALVTASLVGAGVPLALAVGVAVACATLVGVATERLAVHPVRHASPLVVLVMTVAASTALRGIALLVWGTTPYSVPAFSAGPPVALGAAVIARQDLWVLGLTAAAMVGLYLFFERTIPGTAMRACADNPMASRLMGISPGTMSLLAFGISALLAGLAGAAVAPITLATYEMGLMLGLKGFVAAVIGGLRSTPGAVLGGLFLGVLESVGAGLISSGYKDALAFSVLLAVLVFRPQGLLAGLRQRAA
ncbi:MAG TPA: branched-chain amino acid ABC transporter permease [Chloroflexota bacterium]|jgi:branched-chain amino acid transport system permease protein|nr:branched-chain amino acid ABC transporter permease [Chloroflexota bacterium]